MRHSTWLWLWIGLACGAGSYAQDSAREVAEEDIRQAVVMIEASLDGAGRFGAGIIVGADSDSVYIATANHLLREGSRQAGNVRVQFRWLGGRTLPGAVLPQPNPQLDLAAVRVDGLQATGIQMDGMPFEAVGSAALRRGDPLYLVGNPARRAWRINATPEKFSDRNGDLLEFESTFLARGHSGGALLNQEQEIVGMLKSEDPPYGEAVDIQRVTAQFRKWGLPVLLGAPPAPRRFSSVSVGVRACALTPAGVAYCWGRIGTYRAAYVDERIDFETLDKQEQDAMERRIKGAPYSPVPIPYRRTAVPARGAALFSASPHRVRTSLRFQSITAGTYHTCAVTAGGAGYCWGSNEYGQLGNGSKDDSIVPVPVSGGLTFRSLGVSKAFTCGMAANEGAYCWGAGSEVPYYLSESDRHRRLNEAAFEDVVEPKPALAGERLRSMDFRFNWQFVTAAGGMLRYFRGDRRPLSLPDAVEIDSVSGPCVLAKTGDVYCWGDLSFADRKAGSPARVPGGHSFRSLSATSESACAVAKDGAAYCWGENRYGQLGNGSTSSSRMPVPVAGNLTWESVSVGLTQACGISNGAVYCWGVLPGTGNDERAWPRYGAVPTPVVK
ncbi:MAG TPA: trypsin-like peptidase domain-containing protein [Bryobacteraceae bacterium]|nr:trypsin-like peptidase domain-containing protein [Bryobacteraceae bacterium]